MEKSEGIILVSAWCKSNTHVAVQGPLVPQPLPRSPKPIKYSAPQVFSVQDGQDVPWDWKLTCISVNWGDLLKAPINLGTPRQVLAIYCSSHFLFPFLNSQEKREEVNTVVTSYQGPSCRCSPISVMQNYTKKGWILCNPSGLVKAALRNNSEDPS